MTPLHVSLPLSKIKFLVILALIVASSVVTTRAWLTSKAGQAAEAALPLQQQIATHREPSRPAARGIETVLVTITPTGFEPAEITRPAGKIILEVDNRSGLEEAELLLDRIGGAREHAVRVRHTALDWSARLDVRPGSYILTEANHPDWSCRIKVTAH